MSSSIELPVFIKGDLTVHVENQALAFARRNISTFGVGGLPWGDLNPGDHFGKPVKADIEIKVPTSDPLSIHTPAIIIRESSIYTEQMAIRFNLSKADRARLAAHITKYGYFPTDWIRKYPRIPSMKSIQTFPLHVLASPAATDDPPVVFTVDNLSPNGILISTENQIVLSTEPGQRLNLVLDPRGWFPAQIRVQGMICRVTDDLNLENGNLIRHLGIKFTRVDEQNRLAFLDLLKDVLMRLREQGND